MGKVKLLLTDITIREIEANMQKCLKGANRSLQEKTRDTRVLKNFDNEQFEVLFRQLDEDQLCSAFMRLLQNDFKAAQVEVISTSSVEASVVFDKYFRRQPPFGPAKKKDEFPDAFVLTALEGWCARHKKKIYVISSDGDMSSGCSENGPLLHLNSITEFVDLVLRAEEDQADFLAQFFLDNPTSIITAVSRAFEDQYVYLHDEDGDGESSVSEVEIEYSAVVSLTKNEVTIELDVTISFTANVSYGGAWDHRSEALDRVVSVPAEVTIQFDPPDYLHYRVTSTTVNNGEPVHIYVDQDAETNYK